VQNSFQRMTSLPSSRLRWRFIRCIGLSNAITVPAT
jgi:hypothetical protein